MHRKHKDPYKLCPKKERNLNVLKQLENTVVNLSENFIEENFVDESSSVSPESSKNARAFEKNPALFLLEIPLSVFIVSSTIHCIVSEFQKLQHFGINHTREKFTSL